MDEENRANQSVEVDQLDFYVVPALYEQRTFFVFRDAVEIKVCIRNGRVYVDGKGYLLPKEVDFFLKYFA